MEVGILGFIKWKESKFALVCLISKICDVSKENCRKGWYRMTMDTLGLGGEYKIFFPIYVLYFNVSFKSVLHIENAVSSAHAAICCSLQGNKCL